MWKIVREVVPGRPKPPTKLGCQDAFYVMRFEKPASVLVACCADGAGSAMLGGEGAKLASRRLGKAIEQYVKGGENVRGKARIASTAADASAGETHVGVSGHRIDPPTRQVIERWFESARSSLEAEAAKRDVPLRELSTTLLAAVVTDDWALAAQLGDGAVVFDAEGPERAYEVAVWPQNHEYVNSTDFLTAERWSSSLVCVISRRRMREVALLTDGLQSLVLRYADKKPHTPFFRGLFDRLRAASDSASLRPHLKSLLDSPAVKERTDDDVTLILACRDDDVGTLRR